MGGVGCPRQSNVHTWERNPGRWAGLPPSAASGRDLRPVAVTYAGPERRRYLAQTFKPDGRYLANDADRDHPASHDPDSDDPDNDDPDNDDPDNDDPDNDDPDNDDPDNDDPDNDDPDNDDPDNDDPDNDDPDNIVA